MVDQTILIYGSSPSGREGAEQETLGAHRVSVSMLQANINSALSDVAGMLRHVIAAARTVRLREP